MLVKPDQRVLSALSALEHDRDFQVVLMWLTTSLDELRRANDSTKDEVLTRWNQGAAQTLTSLIETTKKSRDVLARNK